MSFNDLDIIAAALGLLYGKPTGKNDKNTSQYVQYGYLWKANRTFVSVFSQYYGLSSGSELTVEFGPAKHLTGDY